MEIKGIVNNIMPIATGQKQNGEQWQKQEFIIETLDSKFPKKIAFSLFGTERIQKANIQGGQVVTVKFEAESHEHNGRWYTQLNAWSVTPVQATQPQQAPMQQQPMQQGYQQQAQMYQQQQYAPFAPNGQAPY